MYPELTLLCSFPCSKILSQHPCILRSLQWLKIPVCNHYKVISLTLKTLHTSQPSYLLCLLNIQPHLHSIHLLPHHSFFILPPSPTSSQERSLISSFCPSTLEKKLPPHLRSPPASITFTAHTTD
jgi:hypothetical protein